MPLPTSWTSRPPAPPGPISAPPVKSTSDNSGLGGGSAACAVAGPAGGRDLLSDFLPKRAMGEGVLPQTNKVEVAFPGRIAPPAIRNTRSGEYQEDEEAGVARLRRRVSGR